MKVRYVQPRTGTREYLGTTCDVIFTLGVFKSPLYGACCVVQVLYICMHIHQIYTHVRTYQLSAAEKLIFALLLSV